MRLAGGKYGQDHVTCPGHVVDVPGTSGDVHGFGAAIDGVHRAITIDGHHDFRNIEGTVESFGERSPVLDPGGGSG